MMETIKNNKSEVFKPIQELIVYLVFGLIIMGCSKSDNDPDISSVQLQSTTFTMEEINGCSHSSGGQGTRFLFEVFYTASDTSKIKKVLIKFIPSIGNPVETTISSGFLNNGSRIKWGGCLRFFEGDWLDVETRLQTEDGTISNVSKVRVARPNGAG